jgi:rRNA maturation RNase YbeY|tara:strand:+ start:492 stop:929 length:438 start_codon:yes stop_codon:yes gene_type:complete
MINVQLLYDKKETMNFDDEWLNSICNNILRDKNQITATISIILSNDDKLLQLKKHFFKKDMLTDVITFNLEENGDPIEGEIYISLNRVSENAMEYKQDPDRELKRVIIHGVLHLLDYDDQTSEGKKTMTRLEDHYLSQPVISDQI